MRQNWISGSEWNTPLSRVKTNLLVKNWLSPRYIHLENVPNYTKRDVKMVKKWRKYRIRLLIGLLQWGDI